MSRISTDRLHVLRTNNVEFLELEDGTLYAILYKAIAIDGLTECEDCGSFLEKTGWLVGGGGESFIVNVCIDCGTISLVPFNLNELPDPPEEWKTLVSADWKQIRRKDMH